MSRAHHQTCGSEFIRDAIHQPTRPRRMQWHFANEFAPTTACVAPQSVLSDPERTHQVLQPRCLMLKMGTGVQR